MKRNVFGMLALTAEDFADAILREFDEQDHCTILPNFQTKKGVNSSNNSILRKKGFYCIYKDKFPVYLGYTNIDIGGRVGRFYAAIRGTEHEEENHPAGYKFFREFGQNFSLMTIKSVEFQPENLDISDGIKMENIEQVLISKIKPALNSEIFFNHWMKT